MYRSRAWLFVDHLGAYIAYLAELGQRRNPCSALVTAILTAVRRPWSGAV